MTDHYYLPSGWCVCGNHRQDGRRKETPLQPLTIAEIREILGDTYTPRETR